MSANPTPKFRPVNEWPLVLVGPIVRRVTNTIENGVATGTSVAVFVATSRPCRVRLTLYDGTSPVATELPASQEEPTRIIGARLHAAVVEAVHEPALAGGHVYGYDLEFIEQGQSPRTLEDLGLLRDDEAESVLALGYEFRHRPGFSPPGPLATLRMVHCSCRKAHGGGVDMLPAVDTLIKKSRDGEGVRPQQLFLTGDQIYADDVATGLLHTLREVGALMLGWQELVPYGAALVSRHHAAVDLVQRSEKYLFTELGKPKTHYAANHLLFLGEWLAMYAMCWSPVLWMRAPGQPLFTFDLHPSLTWPAPRSGEGDTTPAVLEMAQLLPNTRRALANIATYMIFDDHEVTDDWHLNGALDLRFRSSAGGRRLLRNALLAYAVFQDWGNKPEDYTAGSKGGDLIALIGDGVDVAALLATPGESMDPPQESAGELEAGIALANNPGCCDELLDIGVQRLTFANKGKRMRWDYEVIGPEHHVIVLDTRTWRYFPELDPLVVAQGAINQLVANASGTGELVAGEALQTVANNLVAGMQKLNAGLISKEAMGLQMDERLGAVDPATPLFVVTAAPVITFKMVDLVQRGLVRLGGADKEKVDEEGEEKWENEPWLGNHGVFRALMEKLRDRLVIFLSGDVHYGYTAEAVFEDENQNGSRWWSRYRQLCASPARNATSANRLLTAVDWLSDDKISTAQTLKTFYEVATAYTIFPFGSGPRPAGYASFHDEVVAELTAEREHLLTAISNHDEYGAIIKALREGRWPDAGREVEELARIELMLLRMQWNNQNPFEFVLGDSIYATPGSASQLAQMIALAMDTHNIPLLKEWSIGTVFSFDRRDPATLVRPPWIKQSVWDQKTQANVYPARVPYERLNYCSVSDSNVCVIEFKYADEGPVYRLVHELLWHHDSSSLTDQPEFCTTHHELDLFGSGPPPWSQVEGGGE